MSLVPIMFLKFNGSHHFLQYFIAKQTFVKENNFSLYILSKISQQNISDIQLTLYLVELPYLMISCSKPMDQ